MKITESQLRNIIIEEILRESKKPKGLWYNIRKRREKGLPRKKPGQKGYPKTLDIEGKTIDIEEQTLRNLIHNHLLKEYLNEKDKDQDVDGDNDFDDVRVARYIKSGMSKEEALEIVKKKPLAKD